MAKKRFLTVAWFIFILILGWSVYFIKQADESHTRKSKPPIKIKHPDEIKDRKDICYDGERRSDKSMFYYVQAKT